MGSVSAAPGPADGDGREAAASYLSELLLRPGRFRSAWEQYVERSRPGHINKLAVAEVLARHLWKYPRRSGDAEVLPRQLKDTVARALSGKLLSKPALQLFIDSFALPRFEQDQLWRLWQGSARTRMLSGPGSFRGQARQELETAIGPAVHRTLSVHDHHYVGADGLALRTRTLQVVEAITDDVQRIPYMYDTSALSIGLIQGCIGLGAEFREVTSGIFGTDLLLARTLGFGETATLEYVTTFSYQQVPHVELTGQLAQYRRAVRRRMENADIRVEFDPERLPATVWWARWDGIDGEVMEQEAVDLDTQCSAHRFLRSIENTVVGFHWAW
ncbi:MAG TPA: hypothetical protein VG268_05055 [Streptosporangiaceae bacterium]|jgi:hypothetical protein|nr:hypothetical protein [Streptosporangiaceae bacterium]